MNDSFGKYSKYFFWIAGALTALGSFPLAISPVAAPRDLMGLTYFDQSPQMAPIVGHWGFMIAILGTLLFISASAKHLRTSTIIFATLEKIYIVCAAIYCFVIRAPYAHCYLVALLVDGPLAAGGIWYLLRSWYLKEA